MALTTRRAAACLAVVCLLALCARSVPAAAQTLEVVPDTGRLTVGDSVRLRLVVRQYEGDALLEQVPHPLGALGDGVRLLVIDSMRPLADRLLEARATMTFYRPGKQTIPAFAIDFRRGAVILHGTLRSEPVPIEIAAVLAEGSSSTLRDIKEPAAVAGPDPRWLFALVALAFGVWLRRRQRRRWATALDGVSPAEPAPSPPALDPFAVALERLAVIERAHWARAGEVARHYEAVTDALRDYLEAAEAIPARERTTTELGWALPRHLASNGQHDLFERVFESSDLVKFARRRPDARDAALFLADARTLLTDWRRAADRPVAERASAEAIDALR